jgi:hypothetical protein
MCSKTIVCIHIVYHSTGSDSNGLCVKKIYKKKVYDSVRKYPHERFIYYSNDG